jgi:hypothetical protein
MLYYCPNDPKQGTVTFDKPIRVRTAAVCPICGLATTTLDDWTYYFNFNTHPALRMDFHADLANTLLPNIDTLPEPEQEILLLAAGKERIADVTDWAYRSAMDSLAAYNVVAYQDEIYILHYFTNQALIMAERTGDRVVLRRIDALDGIASFERPETILNEPDWHDWVKVWREGIVPHTGWAWNREFNQHRLTELKA